MKLTSLSCNKRPWIWTYVEVKLTFANISLRQASDLVVSCPEVLQPWQHQIQYGKLTANKVVKMNKKAV